jgi:ferritin-like metal-binding protein YciE
MNTLRNTFLEELADIYDAEKQLLKALPKMAKAAENEELRAGFEEHLSQTEGHVNRLEQVFEAFGEKPKSKKCKAMKGLIEEGKDLIDEDQGDAALIAAAQKVEHYEIAAYGSLRTWAERMGEEDAAELLELTLGEEKATDQKLSQVAETAVNPRQEEMEPTKGRAS